MIGVLYPTFLQALKVSPNQESLEAPYIQRNIDATRAAFGLDHVAYHQFAGRDLASPRRRSKPTCPRCKNIRLWDPSNNIALETVTRRQSIRSYYNFNSLSVDRYYINGKLTPVLIGARQLNSANLPSNSWVNQHLQYTHGIGVAVVAANQVDGSTGNPVFDVSNVPPQSTNGMPTLTQPDIYFGLGLNGWVVANTKQPELNYQVNIGRQRRHAGRVALPGHRRRRRRGDLLAHGVGAATRGLQLLDLESDHSKSRVMFVRNVRQMAQKAAPFLSFDSQPYAVIANGEVDYVIDGYTTTTQYPYSENASNLNITTGGLPSSFNYARNAVKVVVNAYIGCDEVLRHGPERSPHRGLPFGVSFDVPAHERDARDDPHPPALPPEPLLGAGGHVRALPHHEGERLLLGL